MDIIIAFSPSIKIAQNSAPKLYDYVKFTLCSY